MRRGSGEERIGEGESGEKRGFLDFISLRRNEAKMMFLLPSVALEIIVKCQIITIRYSSTLFLFFTKILNRI